MNAMTLKGIFSCLFMIVLLTSAAAFFYDIATTSVTGLVNGEDYIYFDPKQIPALLLLPVMIVLDLFFISLLFSFKPCGRKAVKMIMQKLMTPVIVYAIAALVIGFLLSMVISVYPLGTNYYQCKSTSLVSSGSYYGRSKEICEQKAYSSKGTAQEKNNSEFK